MERFPTYLRLSEQVPGWTRGSEARALMRAAYDLPPGAAIVEIGAFLGSSSILLAGARKLRRSGALHCIDPFDASGDPFSVPEYKRILTEFTKVTQLEAFHANLRSAGLARWVTVHQGQAENIGGSWTFPVDMIFMDGDQSPEGVSRAFASWRNWLKPGGLLALHNSDPHEYEPEHDGHFQLRQRILEGSEYTMEDETDSTTFLRKKSK